MTTSGGSGMVRGGLRWPALADLLGLKAGLLEARFLRFLLVGILNTIFGYAMFLASLKLGLSTGVALLVSTLAGVAFNFQTSRNLVFRSTEPGLLLRFAGVYVMIFVVDYVGVVWLKQLGLRDWAAQALMVAPMAALSFVAQRNLVFGNPRSS